MQPGIPRFVTTLHLHNRTGERELRMLILEFLVIFEY